MDVDRPVLSVVIPTFERRQSLERLLDALARQTFDGRFEVIVVDDGSADGTGEWLRGSRTSAYELRFFGQEHAGPAAARNKGVAESRGQLIVFLDDDVVPDPCLLRVHVAAHEAIPNSVVCGTMLPPDGWKRPVWIRWEEQKLVAQYDAMRDGIYACTFRQFFTGNASLARGRFLAAGGFDVGFARAEDVDLGFRLDRLGMRFVFEPKARTLHYPRRTFAAWQRTPYRYGQADVVMHREKSNPVLGLVFHEFHRRHWLSRVVARACVGSPLLYRAARITLASVARAAGWAGRDRLASVALSGLFNLLYWQGVSDALGGPKHTWSAVAERRPPLARRSVTMDDLPEIPTRGPTPDDQRSGARVTRGALAMLGTQPFTWAASLSLAVLLPRYLGDAGLGALGVAANVAGLVGAISMLGLQFVLVRRAAAEPARAPELAWAGAIVVTLTSVALGLGVIAAVVLLGMPGIDPTLLTLMLVGIPGSQVQGAFLSCLVGLGQTGRSAWIGAGAAVASTMFGLAALVLGGGVYGFALWSLVASVLATPIVIRLSGFAPTSRARSLSLLRDLATTGLPFLSWNVALRVRGGLDVAITGLLLQSSVAGWLYAAYRVTNVMVFIPTIITTPLLPALSRLKDRRGEYAALLRQGVATVLLLTVGAAATIFVLAPVIPSALGWNEQLQQAVPVMMILAFQQPLVAVDIVLGSSLIALGFERPWLKVAVAGAIFNPALNVVLIPIVHGVTGNGAIGAALVELLTEVLFLVGALRLTPRGMLTSQDAFRAARIVLAGAALIAASSALRPVGALAMLAGGGTAYLASGLALGVLHPRQLHAVRQALRPA